MSLFLHAHLLHTIFQFAWYYYCQDRSTILWDSIELQPTEIRYLIRCNRLKVAFLSINFDFAEKKASNPPLFFSSWWGANNKDMLVSPSINSSFLKKYFSIHLKNTWMNKYTHIQNILLHNQKRKKLLIPTLKNEFNYQNTIGNQPKHWIQSRGREREACFVYVQGLFIFFAQNVQTYERV